VRRPSSLRRNRVSTNSSNRDSGHLVQPDARILGRSSVVTVNQRRNPARTEDHSEFATDGWPPLLFGAACDGGRPTINASPAQDAGTNVRPKE
jgi:hypothetical protein